MPEIVLVADTQRPIGSSNARRLRRSGRIPAVVYGHSVQTTSVSVEARALRAALSTSAGNIVVLELDLEGVHHLAMAKVVDHHPVRHTIAHVDFLVVDRNERVTADIPVTLVGEAEAVKRDGGTVEQLIHAVTLSMLPGSIPDAITVDVTDLEPGGFIRVGDLTLPSGVSTDLDAETPVVTAAHAVQVEEAGVAPEAEAAESGPVED